MKLLHYHHELAGVHFRHDVQ